MRKQFFLTVLAATLFSVVAQAQSKAMAKLDRMTVMGKNVYISSTDSAMQAYATDYMKKWHYWNVVDNPSSADFEIRFVGVVNSNNNVYGYVDYIDPNNDNTLYETNEVHKLGHPDGMIDYGFVEKLADQKIKQHMDDRDTRFREYPQN